MHGCEETWRPHGSSESATALSPATDRPCFHNFWMRKPRHVSCETAMEEREHLLTLRNELSSGKLFNQLERNPRGCSFGGVVEPLPQLGSGLGGASGLPAVSAVSSGCEGAFCGIPEPSTALCTETVAPNFSVNKKLKMFRENLALPREPKMYNR